jgi:hypothetical protein
MGTLDSKKIKLQARAIKIANVHHQNHVALMDLRAQNNCENLLILIDACQLHIQLELCKRYVDQFESNPYLEVPDFV